jgi:hypothetical protein
MSTILKALRRLEEDSAERPTEASTSGDAELRERILAEESAAAALGGDRVRSSPAATAAPAPRASRSIASPGWGRRLTPVALGLVLLASVGSALWYWNGGAGSLDPTQASAPVAPTEPVAAAEGRAPVPAPLPPAAVPAAPRGASEPAPSAVASAPSTSAPVPTTSQARASGALPAPVDATTDEQAVAAAPVPALVLPVPAEGGDGGGADSAAFANAPVPQEPAPSHLSPMVDRSASSSAISPPPPEIASPKRDPASMIARRSATAEPESGASARETSTAAAPAPPPRSASAPPESPAPGTSRPAAGSAPGPTVGSVSRSARPSSPEVDRLDRRGLPDVTVLRTAWHPIPERRTAKVRLETSDEVLSLREGDAVGGLVVQEISPSGVVFRSGEVEIRRRVGQGDAR